MEQTHKNTTYMELTGVIGLELVALDVIKVEQDIYLFEHVIIMELLLFRFSICG